MPDWLIIMLDFVIAAGLAISIIAIWVKIF